MNDGQCQLLPEFDGERAFACAAATDYEYPFIHVRCFRISAFNFLYLHASSRIRTQIIAVSAKTDLKYPFSKTVMLLDNIPVFIGTGIIYNAPKKVKDDNLSLSVFRWWARMCAIRT